LDQHTDEVLEVVPDRTPKIAIMEKLPEVVETIEMAAADCAEIPVGKGNINCKNCWKDDKCNRELDGR
jgi:hypothetical protein